VTDKVADVTDDVQLHIDGPVARLRLNRAPKRNAITTAMYAQLAQALADVSGRADVRVLVFTGSGGSFTAGNDLADMATAPALDETSPPRRFLDALVALPQVLVIGVDGPAIGVGTTVLLHADLVVATRRSVFALPFVNLGLVPEAAATLLLPAAVGHVRAAELMLLGRRFTADEASQWGLLNSVVDGDEADLDAALGELVAALIAQPAEALRQTRRLLRAHRLDATRARLAEDGAVLAELAAQLRASSAELVTERTSQ
jgi:enoyl-CoA hydratase/carnithine racemase